MTTRTNPSSPLVWRILVIFTAVFCAVFVRAEEENNNDEVDLTVTVTSVSIESDKLIVSLVGSKDGVKHPLSINLIGDSGTSTLVTYESTGSGSWTLAGWRSSIATGVYSKFQVVWKDASGEIDYDFECLGVYRNSQYNIPDESDSTCSGNSVTVHFTTSDCTFSTGSMSDTFKSKVLLNGSGVSVAKGKISREWYCINQSGAPSGATSSNTFRDVTSFQTACNNSNLSGTTVAVKPDHPKLGCGDRVYIADVGVKTVTDHGAGLATAQLDNFTTDGRCSGIVDIGDKKVFKLPVGGS